MSIAVGQTVQVKPGQQDGDTGTLLAGWSGRVIAVHQEYNMVEVEWDSTTLMHIPDAYIRHSIDGGYDYLQYNIESANLDIIEPKDTPEQVREVQKALDAHYDKYELYGIRPGPFPAPEQSAAATNKTDTVQNVDKQLLSFLKTIEGNGSFVTSGVTNFTHPGLKMEGIGEIGFPLNPIQVKEIIKLARKAPFGKGSQTITDSSVRSAWEIDPSQLSFGNESWQKAIQKIIKEVKKGLGIEKQSITASLYKMLVYQPGDFFLPHKDSEKEKGMFATLVIGLPSTHTGGELAIRFDGREEAVDLSTAASSYKMPYVAFFADCEHEIKPVTSGYRVCLVYNLLQSEDSPTISGPQFMGQARQMAELLQSMAKTHEYWPRAILLSHQYTPANFSLGHLKHHDRPRAEALFEAAEKAGYFAKLGLVTHYRMGQLEGADYYYDYRRRSRYYREEEASEGTMGEVYEEYTSVQYWSEEDTPGLGKVPIREEDMIAETEIGEGKPIEQEEEGYTGNAGMTIEYWYHYGALFLWPRKYHSRLLASLSIPVRLQWLRYYLQHWDDAQLNPQEHVKQLLSSFNVEDIQEEDRYEPIDFSVVATAFAQLEDDRFLKQQGEALLSAVFGQIKVENWLALLQQYGPNAFHPIFQNAARRKDVFVIRHLLDILMALDKLGSTTLDQFILHQIEQLPDYLHGAQLHKLKETSYYGSVRPSRKETVTDIVENVLALSPHNEKDTNWVNEIVKCITGPMPRKYVNGVLAPILLSQKYKGMVLAKTLYEACLQDLKARTVIKPSPPSDWVRSVPKSSYYQKIWNILEPFFSSPDQQVFDYQANQSYRKEMERAIKNVTIDLKMETIRKGSPHTLRLTKTQAAYERKLKKWNEDVSLLEQLKEKGAV